MNFLEKVSDEIHNSYYVDLFVRSSNTVAINMYKKLGYDVYQTVDKYDDIVLKNYLVITQLMVINLLKMLTI